MLRLKKLVLLASVFAGLGSCTHKTDISKGVVFKVNGTSLSVQEFGARLAKKLKAFDALAAKDPSNVQRAKTEILSEFLIARLVRDYAEIEKITVSNDELDAEVASQRRAYSNALTFKSALAEQGIRLEDWREGLRQSLIEKKVFEKIRGNDAAASKDNVRKYYESHKAEFEAPPQVHLQQIFVGKLEEAELLHKEVKRGKSFTELAKKFSVSPDATRGGDLGFVAKGTIPVFDQGFQMRVNEVSPVIRSNYGYHILKLLEKRPASHISYERAARKIAAKLNAEAEEKAFTDWLQSAIRTAKVEKNDALLESIVVQTQGKND